MGIVIVSLIILFFFYTFFSLKRKNSDLELAHKNSEIQNYIIRINELEKLGSKKRNLEDNISEKLSELDLTKREKKVLRYIAEGYSNDDIADEMFISKNTVKSHIKNIYIKLDVKSRVQVIQKLRDA